jgi:hypothetical protein
MCGKIIDLATMANEGCDEIACHSVEHLNKSAGAAHRDERDGLVNVVPCTAVEDQGRSQAPVLGHRFQVPDDFDDFEGFIPASGGTAYRDITVADKSKDWDSGRRCMIWIEFSIVKYVSWGETLATCGPRIP